MSGKVATPPETITLAEAAAKLGVSVDKVRGWIERGHLQAFLDPDAALGASRPGPKTVRIWRADWDRFVMACTVTGRPEGPAREEKAGRTPPGVKAAGTDGVSRRTNRARRA